MNASLSDLVVASRPVPSHGYSGNTIEEVTLADGRRLIRKRVSPAWDWLSRATGDDGRAVAMWDGGLFERIPASIDHATVAVEADADGNAWTVYMRDVSTALVPHGTTLDGASVRLVLAAMVDLHRAFAGVELPDLCRPEDRYRLLSPHTARREQELGTSVGDTLSRGWDAFSTNVPRDVADQVLALVEEPALLGRQLGVSQQTLVHGDIRLSNLGFDGERTVLIDWGERTGPAPGAVDLASFLGFDAARLAMSREEVIAEYRRLCGEPFDERALHLALLGGMVQLGCHFGLGLVFASTDRELATARGELSWWTAAARAALETW